MNTNPILTIFLLTYNHENSIRKTIESIISQKTNFPFIVKILEDCSTDKTLETCKEYERKYPHLFKLIAQKKNTNREHIYWAKENEINTQYWCIIEGDDWYLNNLWFEKGLSFLEKNKEYNCYCGDVLYSNEEANTKYSCITEVQKKSFQKLGHDLSFDNYVYVQTSARIYRNIIDFKEINNFPKSDIYIWYLFLDKGKVYLEHELMSQYNISSNGIWNTLSDDEKLNRTNKVAITCNKFFNYKYAKFYARQIKNRKFKLFKMLLGSHFAMWLVTNNYLKI
ncbi:MAG: glycosyltransferase [Candidatus Gastranaerophilales bacterium]|nr:glycosyltransferase [Candidatus Gastranaerophilales bacterium]